MLYTLTESITYKCEVFDDNVLECYKIAGNEIDNITDENGKEFQADQFKAINFP